MTISKEEIQQLRSRFSSAAHSIRQGHSNSAKTKCQWFVYLDRIAIIDRLDEVFPGEWEYKMTEPQLREKHYSAIGSLTIKGITREFNGTQSLGGFNPENDEKGCGTDVFRRAASMWGIGSYLHDAPNLWTALPAKGNWDEQRKYEGEAKAIFNRWFNGSKSSKPPPQPESNGSEPEEPTTVSEWPRSRIDDLYAYWLKKELTEADICRFADVTDKYDHTQWAKYQSNQDASAAIQAAWNAEMDNGGSAEESAIFNYMSYVGKSSNLLFATKPEGAKNNLVATAFEGRGGIRKWGSDELYEQLQLSQYTKLKGENVISDWVKMVVPVEFFYVFVQDDVDEYCKITGIKGTPEIAF